MKLRFIPSRLLLSLIATATIVAAAALFAGVALKPVALGSGLFAAAVLALAALDLALTWRAWRASQVRMVRHLPSAFAIGVRQLVRSEERRVGKECRSRRAPYH